MTVSLCTVPVLRDPSHANLIYITQLRQDEETVSHIVGLSAWFAFQLQLLKSGTKVNVEHCESQGLLHIQRKNRIAVRVQYSTVIVSSSDV